MSIEPRTELASATMALQAVFEEFKRTKQALQGIHQDTVKCFEKIEETLSTKQHGRELATQLVQEITMAKSPPSNAATAAVVAGNPDELDMVVLSLEEKHSSFTNLAETLYTKEERDDVCKLFTQGRPSLIVVGQTNSGKSSIINEILGYKVVSTSDQPCTSRIVKMTYSEENYIELVAQSGQVLEKMQPKGIKIPRELIELKHEDRENQDRVTAIIKAGFNIAFLKSGVDIIDSPGRNENDVLDDLVRKQLDSILPFIVYIIDGHNLFTALDKAVLKEITSDNTGGLEIFFVVSKIEPRGSDSSDEEDDDEEDGNINETVQENKKRRVFEQLVKNGFLSPDKDMNDNENFHGLSAWKLHEYRCKKKKSSEWNDPDNIYKEYTDAFQRFQSCLKTFSESCLKGCIKRSCEKLIAVLSRCLYFFIEKANFLKQNRDAMLAMLKTIEDQEAILHRNVLLQIQKQKEEMMDVMAEDIKGLKDDVAKDAKSFQYSEEFVPAKDGYVKGSEAVKQCRYQIEQMVFNKVQKEVKINLDRMFQTRDNFLKDLVGKVKKIEEEAFSEDAQSNAASEVLYLNLVGCYEPDNDFRTGGWTIKRIMNRMVEWMKLFFQSPLIALKGKVNVGKSEWKEKVALETLSAINLAAMGEEIVKTLNTHFESCHKQFEVELKNIVDVLTKGETLKDDQRKAILDFAPDVASLEMLCHSINDVRNYGRPQKGEMIGAGAQGNVFTCSNITTDDGKPCVVKVVPVPNESFLKDLTLELHTSRNLNHPNILPIVCTIIEPNIFTGITVSIVSERMTSDLHHALPKITSLRERLNILLDIASALQYLHKQGLMHRDIKLQNVLVDENKKGYLTDMGLCKPEGLATGSLVGTPIAMAPEMIQQKYTKSVDVYAFGVLMWRVCEGTGKQPSNIFLFPIPIVMLVMNAKDNRKPERLDTFLPSCWALMERCWETEPDRRPTFDSIVQDLKDILADKSVK